MRLISSYLVPLVRSHRKIVGKVFIFLNIFAMKKEQSDQAARKRVICNKLTVIYGALCAGDFNINCNGKIQIL